MHPQSLANISESMQMYLATIARLSAELDLVPLSRLAEALSVSPVSVNEMCRKLQAQGLLTYEPYKGVALTSEGEQRACYVLRRHRLWEVFLVEKLGMAYAEAHQAACQLEHSTPDMVTDRLDAFLDHPAVNPEGMLIPRCVQGVPQRVMIPLAQLSAGERGHILRCDADQVAQSFLAKQGVRPGTPFEVLASTSDHLLVRVGKESVAVARALAEAIEVEPAEPRD